MDESPGVLPSGLRVDMVTQDADLFAIFSILRRRLAWEGKSSDGSTCLAHISNDIFGRSSDNPYRVCKHPGVYAATHEPDGHGKN